jgi:hypothetical protein
MLDRDTVISIHEAGHAVVARALALHCGAATVALPRRGSVALHSANCPRVFERASPSPQQPRARSAPDSCSSKTHMGSRG